MERVIIALRPSRTALAFIAAAAAATLILLAFLPGTGAAMVWCVAMSCHALDRHRRVRTVRVQGKSIVVDEVAGEVVAGSFVAPWLTIVHWRPPGAWLRRTLLVLPDMLDAEAFRKLRVALKWA